VNPETVESIAQLVVDALGLYLALGLLFAVPFVARGVGKVDPDAAEGSWGFRVMVFPGVVALWPLMLRRWRAGAPPTERSPHRAAARAPEGSAR